MSEININAKKEYRELINLLNKGNKTQNEKTEAYFYIDRSNVREAKLFAALNNGQKFLICVNVKRNWQLTEPNFFPNFSGICLELLKSDDLLSSQEITMKILNTLFADYD